MRAVLKKQCGLVGFCFGGRMAFDIRLSRARTGVVAMRQDSINTNNWIPQNWYPKGIKFNKEKGEMLTNRDSVRLGCILYVVEILSPFMILVKMAPLQTISNCAFSQDAEMNHISPLLFPSQNFAYI
jgi:hypothetical protein